MKKPVLLINANIAKPPVSPVGLEYVGEALVAAGLPVRVLDLSFEPDWKAALERELQGEEPLMIGLSVRNTDDCSFASKRSFLPWISEVVDEVKRLSRAYLVLGGVGFSAMPETVMKATAADAGIAGDGEEAAVALARCLMNREDVSDLPNLVYRRNGEIVINERACIETRHLPLPRRRLFDNKKYEDLGAIVGIETKRGCPRRCIFCADPVARGASIRLRPPPIVVEEFRDLLAQEVSWFHLSDSEFNQPIRHAKEVCRALIDAGMGDKLKWYCYCSPTPFDKELAGLMKSAGCRGVNFGVDSLSDEQLARLGRGHSMRNVRKLVGILKESGLKFIFDLLIGGPGETEQTVRESIEKAKEMDIPLVGIADGVRVYPGTIMGEAVARGFHKDGLHACGPTGEPLFYLSPYLGTDASKLISELVAGDRRFLFLATPGDEASYNYADDDTLSRMIAAGARGAYWDILSGRGDA